MKFATKVIKAGITPDPSTGAIMTPVYMTSTYQQSSPGVHQGYEYSRTQNPTRKALEDNLAALENARHGLCFASGMAATDAVLHLLQPGDEVIATNDLYGGTYRIFKEIYEPMGIRFHLMSMKDPKAVAAKITNKTKMIWIETPTNPLLQIIDIKEICALKQHALVCVDNTFATPYLQQPFSLGADLVVHSATKYLSGHSDVVLGAAMVQDDRLAERLRFIQNSCGNVPGPMDAFLTLRGVKTLHLRMKAHCENAAALAGFLQQLPAVDEVYWPGMASHPNHEVAKEQMRDFGGMVSFSLKGGQKEDAINMLEKLKIFTLAESLGGVESLAGHPATMTHASIPKAEREKAGLKDSLIRLSVGVEDIHDLIEDIEQAIGK